MPVYEYGCKACGETFEAWQRITDAPLKKCERCGSSRVARIISETSFILKGSGWYVTDYARKSSPGGKSSDSAKDKSSAEPKTPTATDAKKTTD